LDEEIKRLNNDINKRALEVKVDKEKYITTYLGYQNLKDFEKVLEESAIKNLQLVIGIEKIIDELKIDISEKETEEHLTKMAKVYGMTLDMLKQRLNNNYDGIKTVLIQEKVFDKLIEINK
jgi:FKBP-type peptidyl-prolyl cis-trans isomerase (trigger factor)